jgi:hypothetical protein
MGLTGAKRDLPTLVDYVYSSFRVNKFGPHSVEFVKIDDDWKTLRLLGRCGDSRRCVERMGIDELN